MNTQSPFVFDNVSRCEIGDEFIAEVEQKILAKRFVSILGPINGGKQVVVEQVRQKLENRGGDENPQIVHLNWRYPRPLTGLDILNEIATRLNVSPISAEDWTQRRPFQEYVGDLLRTKKIETGNRWFCFLIEGLLNIPSRYARGLIDALLELSQFAGGVRFDISACITGSADFLPLCVGQNSPLRDSTRFLAVRFEKNFARQRFGKILVCKRDIADDAFDYLYDQINGSPFLLKTFIEEMARQCPSCSEETKPPWTLYEVKKLLNLMVEDRFPSEITLRVMMRGIGANPTTFDLALRLLTGADGDGMAVESLRKEFASYPDFETSLLQLEVFELVARDSTETRIVWPSPVLEAVLKQMLNPGCVADCFAAQQRWDKAWEAYEALDPDHLERPLSGPARFRQRDLVPHWCDHLHLCAKAKEGPRIVYREFLRGAKFLLGFSEVGLAIRKKGKLQWLLPDPEAFSEASTATQPVSLPSPDSMDQEFADASTRTYKVLFNSGFRNRLVCGDTKLEKLWPNEEDDPFVLLLERPIGSAISHSEYDLLSHALDAFLTAYEFARRLEYDRTARTVRERHLRVVEEVNKALFGDSITMESVAIAAIRALRDIGEYRRVLIAFVDDERKVIEDVRNDIFVFPTRSIYDIRHPEKDVLPWVVHTRQAAFIPDAKKDPNEQTGADAPRCVWNHEMASKIDPPMKAISVVPMVTGDLENPQDPIIGAIHFERKDGELPPLYEREMMFGLAKQIAAIFHLTRRLIPRELERERAAMRTLHEFRHMLARSIPIAQSRLAEARHRLGGPPETVDTLLLQASDHLSGALKFVQTVIDKTGGDLELRLRDVSVKELVETAERIAREEERSLDVTTQGFDGWEFVFVRVDFDLLRLVFSLLANNAVKHSRQIGAIAFHIEAHRSPRDESKIEIHCWNAGASIPENQYAQLFNYGYSTHPHGTGVGLYTVRRILHAHGAEIRVQNPGERQGALFVLSIPIKSTGGLP